MCKEQNLKQNRVQNKEQNNIILIGMMGVGKTAVGRMLARDLAYHFIDTDTELEKVTGLKLRDIRSKYGEIRYNAEEALLVKKLGAISGTVVSTGGNMVLAKDNAKILQQLGFMVYLNASPVTIYNRTKRKNSRLALSKGASLETIQLLVAEKLPIYQSIADFEIDVDAYDLENIVRKINTAFHEFLKG